jgi:EAL domain-containing protein (putative c-di-GMP-specific phosphodiesterase class I)
MTMGITNDILGIKGLEVCLDQQLYSTNYKDFVLKSAFQPIISIPHRRTVGYEGLIRPENNAGHRISPLALFDSVADSSEGLKLDRVCRNLHAHNFGFQDNGDKWLFLNLDSHSISDKQPDPGFMTQLFESSGLKPNQVVVEILESQVADRAYLVSFIRNLKKLGCLIAIDDFGAGHSNFDRVWELEPDIVKVDRSLIVRAAISPKVKRVLSSIVSMIHGSGSLVILEGIETREQALLAMEVGADMVQGFFFSKPEPFINQCYHLDNLMTELLQEQRARTKKNGLALDAHFRRFQTYFEQAITQYIAGESFENCVKPIFNEERAVRCYMLDAVGHQIGHAIHTSNSELKSSSRFAPLANGDNANWSQKHYHYRAIRNPGKIQVTSPYLSLTGSHMCVTISKAVEILGNTYVFCCDLNWQD